MEDMATGKELQIFDSEEFGQVRVVMVEGEPWFVAADVCAVLGLTNPTEALKALDDDEKNTLRISEGIRGNPNMNVISESGLYTLVTRSIKPYAKRFRKWIMAEVIPSIRKHGAYMTPQTLEQIILNPDLVIGLAQRLKEEQAKNAALAIQIEEEQEKNAALEASVEEARPKVLFADSVAASKTSILIGDLAKLIRQNGVDIGQNRLFKWMRENGYLVKRMGDSYNMPTQASMDRGLYEILERTQNNPDGSIRITKTTKVTGRGQLYFVNLFLNGLQEKVV